MKLSQFAGKTIRLEPSDIVIWDKTTLSISRLTLFASTGISIAFNLRKVFKRRPLKVEIKRILEL